MRTVELIRRKDWTSQFDSEARFITQQLGDVVLQIHHVGSTAIPGISAKPIIDILLVVQSLLDLDRENEKLAALGYEPRGENGIKGRRYFVKGGDLRSRHLHAFEAHNAEIARHLLFRYFMIANPDKANEYEALKMSLAERYNQNRKKYSEAKSRYMQKADQEALEWQRQLTNRSTG